MSFLLSRLPAIVPMDIEMPGDSKLPPGMENLWTISGWVTGLVAFALFVAFLVSIGKTGLDALRRGEYTGGMGSVIILICAILLGAASAVFNMVL